ncbi:MAG: hypothetical protein KJO07_17575, partial [Deltaproteobacteria bacterium]|nr:hypothetical protein [Deltaproteobacteria bacterium]
ALAQAFPMAPRDQVLERDVVRLAEATDSWDVAVEAYRQALAAVDGDPIATGELNARLAEILDDSVGDREAALACYQVVISLEPANHPAVSATARLAAGLSRWAEATSTVVRYTKIRDRIDPALVKTLQDTAEAADEWSELIGALTSAIDGEEDLQALHSADLHHRIYRWQTDRDASASEREITLTKVLAHESGRIEALRQLADLRRANPSPELYSTLRTIAEIEPNHLDVRWEAAEVAVEHVPDSAEVERALSSLMGRASAAWRGTAPASSTRDPREAVEWTLGELGRRYAESDRAAAAFELFVDAARLPFPAETQRSLRIRAATVASDQLGDTSSAIEMYRSILSQAPDDGEALEKLGELYNRENRYAELLSLCQHELGLGAEGERKLALRLEIARLVGEVERRAGRVEVLQANLEEFPGHEESVNALTELLASRNQHAELTDVLAKQAATLESNEGPARAAQLWTQVAGLAEQELDDPRRAIEAHRRVVALSPERDSYDALSRLYTARSEADEAVPWLERLLAATEENRTSVVLRLVSAHVDAGSAERAIEVLDRTRE